MPVLPLRSAILGLVVGAALLQRQALLPEWTAILAWFSGAAALAVLAYRMKRPFLRLPLAVAAGMAFGFAWAASMAQHYLADELPKEWEGRDIMVVGTIADLPYRFERGTRFNFKVEQASAGGRALVGVVPPKIALSWYAAYRDNHDDGDPRPAAEVRPGERWRLTVRLQRPHGNANPYGFDYEAWLLEQGVRATGYVRPDTKPAESRRLDAFVFDAGNLVQRGRAWLRERILAALPEKPYAGVIVALVVGDQRAIERADWQVFNRTGVGHLISISGLHITMIAGLCAGLMFQLWRRSFFTRAELPLLLPAHKAAALAGAGAALIYVALAGFGVPAQRTLYMVAVVAAALWCGRQASVSHVLCLALAAVILLDPWAVLWPGFWLSFGAVAIILYVSDGRASSGAERGLAPTERAWRMLRGAGLTQYAVTVGLVPLTMLLFGQVSLISPVANAIAIPVVSLLVTPLSLAGGILPSPLADWVLVAAHALMAWLAGLLGWLNTASAAVWSAPVPEAWIFAAASIGTLWLLAPRGWPSRWLGLAGWLPLVLNAPARPADGEMWVTAFDVGQGSALLVETSRHRLLYDTGPSYSADADAGNRVIVPYLKGRGIDRLDGMIVSHSDNDHAGGALSVLREIGVGWTASSLPPFSPVAAAAPAHRRCIAGQTWSWDGVEFEILHPDPAAYESGKRKSNALSCTLKITLGTRSVLLAGDIEAREEARLAASMPGKLRATVLLAPHHGSGTSSTAHFLNAVQPEIALFQVGYRNRYRHPKPEVFERYGMLGAKRVRTDESGAINLQFGSSLTISEYRTEHARYWYGR
ncbi:MAG TPA: DNA internalization-related competence protein ComEC/Rec2 [Paucimonas sp.]|nr:DNA internalization-related competence protein ComEC/Rec2 [Paucimonas sp.]